MCARGMDGGRPDDTRRLASVRVEGEDPHAPCSAAKQNRPRNKGGGGGRTGCGRVPAGRASVGGRVGGTHPQTLRGGACRGGRAPAHGRPARPRGEAGAPLGRRAARGGRAAAAATLPPSPPCARRRGGEVSSQGSTPAAHGQGCTSHVEFPAPRRGRRHHSCGHTHPPPTHTPRARLPLFRPPKAAFRNRMATAAPARGLPAGRRRLHPPLPPFLPLPPLLPHPPSSLVPLWQRRAAIVVGGGGGGGNGRGRGVTGWGRGRPVPIARPSVRWLHPTARNHDMNTQ